MKDISKTYNEKRVLEDEISENWKDVFVKKTNIPPSVFIIGAQKGGTTTLVTLLSQHSSILSPKIKEHYFFSNSNYYRKGLDRYLKQFKSSKGAAQINIDATANYFENEMSAANLKKIYPNAKIILLLRNPVDRAFSQFKMAVEYGFETQSFEKALELENERLMYSKENYLTALGHDYGFQRLGYRTKGIYIKQIKTWLSHFSRDQILILQSEIFFENPRQELSKVLSFLKLKDEMLKDVGAQNVGSNDEMKISTRHRLETFYKPYNAELFQLLNQKMDW